MDKLNENASREEIVEKINEIIHLLELQREAEIELLRSENAKLRGRQSIDTYKFVNIRDSEVNNVIQ